MLTKQMRQFEQWADEQDKRREKETQRWEYIPGFENYLISDDGVVMSLPGKSGGRSGIIITPRKTNMGYWQACLTNAEGEIKYMYIHRLVAMAFIPKMYNQKDCNIVMHIDDNPSNNKVSNLKWGTQFQNMQGVNTCPVKGKKRMPMKETCIKVMEYFRLNKDFDGKKTELIRLIAEDLDLSLSYVNLILYQFIFNYPDLVEKYSDVIKGKR